jgi:hypothetical protein
MKTLVRLLLKSLVASVFGLMCVGNNVWAGEALPIMKGCISCTGALEKIPQFRIYFNGKQIFNDQEGFFSFQLDDADLTKYALLVTKDVRFDFDKGNTVDHMSVRPDKNYKYYTFKRAGFSQFWLQKEKSLQKKHFVIPTRTIVVLVDPKYFDHLESWSVPLASHVVKLPKIMLKPEVKGKALARAGVKSLLRSLDTTTFHSHELGENVPMPVQNNQTTRISIP